MRTLDSSLLSEEYEKLIVSLIDLDEKHSVNENILNKRIISFVPQLGPLINLAIACEPKKADIEKLKDLIPIFSSLIKTKIDHISQICEWDGNANNFQSELYVFHLLRLFHKSCSRKLELFVI